MPPTFVFFRRDSTVCCPSCFVIASVAKQSLCMLASKPTLAYPALVVIPSLTGYPHPPCLRGGMQVCIPYGCCFPRHKHCVSTGYCIIAVCLFPVGNNHGCSALLAAKRLRIWLCQYRYDVALLSSFLRRQELSCDAHLSSHHL